MKALYVDIKPNGISFPEDIISREEAKSLIHTLRITIKGIIIMREYHGHQIGTKGFMK